MSKVSASLFGSDGAESWCRNYTVFVQKILRIEVAKLGQKPRVSAPDFGTESGAEIALFDKQNFTKRKLTEFVQFRKFRHLDSASMLVPNRGAEMHFVNL